MTHRPPEMPPEEVLKARRRFAGWLRWYMETHPEEVPTKTELARRLGVVKGGIDPLVDPHGTRAPSFGTLLAARELIGVPVDALLFSEPPTFRAPAIRGKNN